MSTKQVDLDPAPAGWRIVDWTDPIWDTFTVEEGEEPDLPATRPSYRTESTYDVTYGRFTVTKTRVIYTNRPMANDNQPEEAQS